MFTIQEVKHEFSSVGKLTPVQASNLLNMEVAFKEIATTVFSEIPDCPNRAIALRKILEAKMLCSQAITHEKGATNGKETKAQTQSQNQAFIKEDTGHQTPKNS